MGRSLVFGLSGQLGEALLAQGDPRLGSLLAMSRQVQPARAGVEWFAGTLENFGAPPSDCARILSLGPLDAFSAWLLRARPHATRIVALGSTGRLHKRDSPSAAERLEAQRLQAAEDALLDHGRGAGIAVTVLRPSLLYGNGRDRSLTPLLARARRWRRLPWPRSATGLREPVHVEDVARAVLACLDVGGSHGRGFDLPGGETIAFDAMVERALARHAPGARLLRLPDALFGAGAALAGVAGRDATAKGWLWRARRDQLADVAPARDCFGYLPRAFEP
jgi:nucleoside-diphosphate-sugar epimerase